MSQRRLRPNARVMDDLLRSTETGIRPRSRAGRHQAQEPGWPASGTGAGLAGIRPRSRAGRHQTQEQGGPASGTGAGLAGIRHRSRAGRHQTQEQGGPASDPGAGRAGIRPRSRAGRHQTQEQGGPASGTGAGLAGIRHRSRAGTAANTAGHVSGRALEPGGPSPTWDHTPPPVTARLIRTELPARTLIKITPFLPLSHWICLHHCSVAHRQRWPQVKFICHVEAKQF